MIDAFFGHPWWVVTLMGIGIIALVAVPLALFSALGTRPDSASVTQAPPVGDEAFRLAAAGVTSAPMRKGGHSELLNNGAEIFPALQEAIGRAERTVNWMVYVWEPGEASDRASAMLAAAALRGIDVRVLLDGMGAIRAPQEHLDRMRRAGCTVAWFRRPHFGKLSRFHRRNHRRAVVIDGCVGFAGGWAVADYWQGDAEDAESWRDSMVRVTGCIASNLQSAFAQLWEAATGEVLVGPAFYPPDPPQDSEGEEISHHLSVIASPSDASSPIRTLFWLSFRTARERIWITTPYFVPDELTREVLMERARAGVDVRVLVPNHHIDAALVRQASHFYYERLLEAGLRIWEFQPTMIHAKNLVVDGFWSIIGSANMDIRSRELNQENVLGILDRGFAEQVECTFLRDLERGREIRLEEWRRRGVWSRIKERFSILFAEQY